MNNLTESNKDETVKDISPRKSVKKSNLALKQQASSIELKEIV